MTLKKSNILCILWCLHDWDEQRRLWWPYPPLRKCKKCGRLESYCRYDGIWGKATVWESPYWEETK